jgi:outer membrane receptor protein involved in Fe transport
MKIDFNLSLISSAIALALTTAPAGAQEEPMEEVTVTGTRLGMGLTAYTPTNVVTEIQLEEAGTINVEDYINSLPQVASGQNSTANFPGNGTATVDLRGFGARRTLVLMNGKRFVPTNDSGTVDVSAFPAALLKRVDLISGGASAIYGSDAITGVVNFILNDEFEGLQVSANYRKAVPYDDGKTYTTDILAGTPFAEGRGHVTVFANYTDRGEIMQADRSYTSVVYRDGTINGQPSLVEGGSSLVPGTRLVIPAAVIPTTLPGYSESTLAVNSITFDSNGNPVAFRNPQDLYNFGPPSYMQLPSNRFQMHLSSDYEILRFMTGYISGTYLRLNSDTNGAPAPISISSTNNVVFDYQNNPYLSPDAKAILAAAAARTNPVGTPAGTYRVQSLGSRLSDDLPRVQYYSRNTYQITAGLKGEMFDSGWSYDAYYQRGLATTTQRNNNQINARKYYQAMNVTTNTSGQAVCIDPSGGCVPINIWGPGNISQEALDFVLIGYNSIADYMFDNAGLNINGSLPEKFSLGAGAIATAVGFEWRKEEYRSQPDSGELVNNLPVLPTNGFYDVSEVFAEINVPLLKDSFLADSLNIRGAIRRSDYNTIGEVDTWSWGAEWTLPHVNWISLRGGKQRAIRAPNIIELYAPIMGAGLTTFSDPCDRRTGLLETDAQQAFCNAWGAPTGFLMANNSVSATQQSNPDLQAETASSYTVGMVLRPNLFPDFLNNFDVTIDYYDIELSDAIAPFGGGVANNINSCFFAQTLSSPFCGNVTRDSLGNVNPVLSTLTNVSLKATHGVDAMISTSFDLDKVADTLAGKFGVSIMGNYQPKNGFQASSVLPFVDCGGHFGTPCGAEITGSGTPETRVATTLNWAHKGISLMTRWRWIEGMRDARFAQAEALGLAVTLQTLLNTVPPEAQTTRDISYLDVSASWQVNPMFRFTLGFNNVLNQSPPLLGNAQVQDNTEPGTYDPVGRTGWLGVKIDL